MSCAQAPKTPAIAYGPPLALSPRTPTSVAAAIASRIAQRPDGIIRTYSLDGDDRVQSYEELWRRSGSIVTGLRKFCRHPGETIVLLIEDAVDFVPAFWACIRGGFVAVPLMSAAREAFHQRRGGNLLAALDRLSNINILADETFAELGVELQRDRGLPVISLDAAEAESSDCSSEDCLAADPLYLVPSSGSTGRLKLVAVREEALLHRSFARDFGKQHHDLGTFALDSISGQNGVFLRCGSLTQMPAAALTARPTSVLDAIEHHQITMVSFTNSAIKRIVAAAEQTNRRWQLGSLRHIGLGGETVVRTVIECFAEFLGRHGASTDIILAHYGTTETGSLVNGANPLDRTIDDHDAVCLGSCALGVGLRIVGNDGEVLAEGDIGNLQATCPQTMFSSYWGEPQASRECFTADGWWRTGDLGRLQNGELSLHGRAKELFVVHGRKFSLTDIDAEIETLLAVGDRAFSCTIHWPGEATERLAVVFVPAAARAERPAKLAENIRRVVARRFGFRPSPVIAASLDDIPFANNGKLRRLELAARVRSGMIGTIEEPGHFSKPIPGGMPNDIGDFEKTLAQIWREALDLHGDLDRHASFFDLGGDSLRSLMLYTAIHEQFGKQISAEAFFPSPTFASLLRLVANIDGKSALTEAEAPVDFAVPWQLPSELRNKLLIHFELWDGNRPTRDRLVAGLNTDGTKTPIFWVFQEAREFRQLAKYLGADQPLYAFRSGLGLLNYEEDEIQAFALRYVSEIIEVCPEGPAIIGGNCQGAIVALAIAEHMLRRRRHVPLLMLMEWGFPLQPYVGPVLLIYGRDSFQGNPYSRYRRPDLAWNRVFAEYAVADIPGDHGRFFEDANVGSLSKIIALHTRKAEQASPTLIPKLAHRALINADEVPAYMVSGSKFDIAVRIRNASAVAWPAWDKSGLMLGNRWIDKFGAVIAWVDGRVPLPEISPGAEVLLLLPITAPPVIGTVQLSVDVVEEGNCWFNLPQNAPLRVHIEILH
jgi:acyl-coenzyme A synthetase/AMP-(fatty) acid ligase/acyl carrier protein